MRNLGCKRKEKNYKHQKRYGLYITWLRNIRMRLSAAFFCIVSFFIIL